MSTDTTTTKTYFFTFYCCLCLLVLSTHNNKKIENKIYIRYHNILSSIIIINMRHLFSPRVLSPIIHTTVSRRLPSDVFRSKRAFSETSPAVEKAQDKMMIKMPHIMEAQKGVIERWVKKEGENFSPTDTICEATLGDLTIGEFTSLLHFLLLS